MKRLNKAALVLVTAGVLSSGLAQAALFDRGSGLIYDEVLNVTWLQDANYAKTSGYDSDGLMDWNAANTWAANLSFHDSVRNVDLTGWRLPTVSPVGANFDDNFSNNGTTDVGYGITSPNSELAYMYYVNLSNLGGCMPNNSAPSSCDYQTGSGLVNTGPFDNLQADYYYSGTAYAPNPDIFASAFGIFIGYQGGSDKSYERFAWAVRPGDVAAVPEPETYSLLLAGLGLLGFAAHRKSKSGILAN